MSALAKSMRQAMPRVAEFVDAVRELGLDRGEVLA